MATADPILLLTLIFYAVIIVGVGYIFYRMYRQRTRKVRKLR
jgi:hypothetical protein